MSKKTGKKNCDCVGLGKANQSLITNSDGNDTQWVDRTWSYYVGIFNFSSQNYNSGSTTPILLNKYKFFSNSKGVKKFVVPLVDIEKNEIIMKTKGVYKITMFVSLANGGLTSTQVGFRILLDDIPTSPLIYSTSLNNVNSGVNVISGQYIDMLEANTRLSFRSERIVGNGILTCNPTDSFLYVEYLNSIN